ncbi:MAG TPA: 50S ribosomal protein L24 [Thermoplasmata archaeon]|nr:50S ribosomal protein L24 [Thermoplasmata archaeon]
MRTSSSSPRRQRRALYTAHTSERRIRMSAPLSRELRARFKRRALPVRKGDTVRVLSGSFVGREERVAKLDRRAYSVTLDNVTLKTAEDKLKPLSIRTSHLVITRLNLADPWRRRSLQVRDEDVTAEELGVVPEPGETTEGEATPASPTAATPPEEEVVAPSDDEDEAKAPAPAKPPRRKSRASATEESP